MIKLNKTRVAEMRLVGMVDYNPSTGEFKLKKDGSIVGGVDTSSGYYNIRSLGVKVYGHRLAFACMKKDCDGHVDHIDQNKSNNKWDNLRVVTQDENNKNRPININNKSGVVGVRKQTKQGIPTGRWESKITVDYKGISLGVYESFEDAVEARKIAEKYYGFHKNHGL